MERIACRLKAFDDQGEGLGQCVLTLSSRQLRAQARLRGVSGAAVWYLIPAGGKPVCVQASPASGEWTCDRGLPWFGPMPEATVLLLGQRPVGYTLLKGSRETPESLRARFRPEVPAEKAEAEAAPRKSPEAAEVGAVEALGKAAEALEAPEAVEAALPEAEEAQEPVAAEEATEAILPEATETEAPAEAPEAPEAQEPIAAEEATETVLPKATETETATEVPPTTDPPAPEASWPWAPDAEEIARALTEHGTEPPFGGGLLNARCARIELGDFEGMDHYIVGEYPAEDGSLRAFVGVPGWPDGLPPCLPETFNRYLPGADGTGYWVRYLEQGEP